MAVVVDCHLQYATSGLAKDTAADFRGAIHAADHIVLHDLAPTGWSMRQAEPRAMPYATMGLQAGHSHIP
ncbi:hypothetical protein [Rhodanobacter koreensis]